MAFPRSVKWILLGRRVRVQLDLLFARVLLITYQLSEQTRHKLSYCASYQERRDI